MHRVLKFLLMLCLIACVSGAAFFLNASSYTILNTDVLRGGAARIPEICTAVLLACLLFFTACYVMACTFNGSGGVVVLTLRLFARWLPLYLGLRLALDGVLLGVTAAAGVFTPVYEAFSEAALLTAVFVFLRLRLSREPLAWSLFRAVLFGLLAAALVALAAVMVRVCAQGAADIARFSAKYADFSAAAELRYIGWRLLLPRQAFLFLLWAALLLVCAYCSPRNGKPSMERRDTENQLRRYVAQVMLLCMAVSMLCGLKLAFPQGAISNIEKMACESHSYTNEKSFSADFVTMQIMRQASSSSTEPLYENTRVRILWGNRLLLKYDRSRIHDTDGWLKAIDVPGLQAQQYDTELLLYVENGRPMIVRSEDIGAHARDTALTAILERVITQGQFDFLEASAPYLLRYDRAFVLPVLKRYAEGNLTDAETAANANIRSDYRMHTAKALLGVAA